MKKTMIALVAAACALMSVKNVAAQTLTVEQPKPYIEVRGMAKTTVQPNKIEVSIQLSELPSKGKITLLEQEKQLATALTEAGVDMNNQLAIISQSTSGDKRKVAYQYKNYLLTLKTPEELAAVFAAFDVNQVQNARVSKVYNDDLEAIKSKLRAEAMVNAKQIATTYATALNQKIGDAVQITADYGNIADALQGQVAGLYATRAMKNEASPIPTNLEMRPIEVEQIVTVRFLLYGKFGSPITQ